MNFRHKVREKFTHAVKAETADLCTVPVDGGSERKPRPRLKRAANTL